jgi:hypothetical protein
MIKMKLNMDKGLEKRGCAKEQSGANTSIQAEPHLYSRVCKSSKNKALK